MFQRRIFFILIIFLVGLIFLLVYLFSSAVQGPVQFVVAPGASARSVADELANAKIIRSSLVFRLIARLKGVDTAMKAGTYTVDEPTSLLRVIDALSHPQGPDERTITILPGWDLRDIAEYLETQGAASSVDFFRVVGQPAVIQSFHSDLAPDKPETVSLEGYLAPDTYRIFSDATVNDIVKKLVDERQAQLKPLANDIDTSGFTKHEILTLASIVEREAQTADARGRIADIFLRRLNIGWALQADSTVHYAIGRKGDVFTTGRERDSDNLWNTYKYPGLPPGSICNPSLESIEAVLHPTKNNDWYFISTLEGEMKYARTLEEHQRNVAKYLR